MLNAFPRTQVKQRAFFFYTLHAKRRPGKLNTIAIAKSELNPCLSTAKRAL